jgi:hypothetical protein
MKTLYTVRFAHGTQKNCLNTWYGGSRQNNFNFWKLHSREISAQIACSICKINKPNYMKSIQIYNNGHLNFFLPLTLQWFQLM